MFATTQRRLCGWLAGLVLCLALLAPLQAAALSASQQPDQVALTWSSDPLTTRTISWRTATGAAAAQVRYGEIGRNAEEPERWQQVAATSTELATAEGSVLLHAATLRDLKPGVRYQYRVGGAEAWSDPYEFTTAPAKFGEFTFLVFGDSQSYDYAVWGASATAAYQSAPAAAFFVNVGDLVDVGQDYAQWEAWFAAAAGLIDAIPAMPVVGNHETYTPERRFSLPLYFTAQFPLPDNGPAGLKRQAYSYDYGQAHFVVLDTQAGEEAEFVPDLLERQAQWLEQDLAATEQPWKLVFMHRPLYGNKPDGINGNLLRAFAGIFARYGVDLVFTAHDHVLARTWPLDAAGNAVPAGEGTVFAAVGRSGTKTYGNVTGKEWNEFFLNPVAEPNYLVVRLRPGSLQVQAKSQAGGLIDEWSIEKPDRKKE